MGRQAGVVLYVLALVAVVVGVDVLFFRHRFWERLMEYRHLRAFGATRIAGGFVAANLAGGYWYITIARSSPPRA